MRRWGGLFLIVSLAGCGYSFQATSPHALQTIYVETFQNKTFEPGVEIDLTNEIIDRFLFDGTLQVVSEGKADAVLKGTLVEYLREPLSFTSTEEVEEYRLTLFVDLTLWDVRHEKILWEEKRFVGDTTFFTTGAAAKSEEKARGDALKELSRRIVDRTVEEWP
jgi:outer membrane lipopolysaccharide assembly protein LptE/RlpB